MYTPKQASTLFDLLAGATSIGVVCELLRKKGLRHSAGSWKELREKRLEPALASGKLLFPELLDILRSAEEHGRQHVFLYKCDAKVAADLMMRERVKQQAQSLNLEDLLIKPRLLDVPSESTFVEIRWDGDNDANLVVKRVERRVTNELEATNIDGTRTTKHYREVPSRAVSLARLARNGNLELRIDSHDASTKYNAALNELWGALESFFPRDSFDIVSLTKAKTALWEKREILSEEVQFSNTTVLGADGIRLRGVSDNPGRNLFQNSGIAPGILAFQAKNPSQIEEQSVIFREKNGSLSKDTRVLVRGEPNEFAITATCTVNDYEYILGKIRSLNT
jgi:hypothetical protein